MILGITSAGPSFHVQGWEASVIITAAILGAIYSIIKIGGRFFRATSRGAKFFEKEMEYRRDLKAVADLAPLVDAILKEFRPNGGSSLRDAMDENTKITLAISGRVDILSEDVKALKDVSDVHATELQKIQDEQIHIKISKELKEKDS